MSRVLTVFLASACALSFAAATALAQPAPSPPPTGGPLNLTDAQRDEIRKLRDETRAARREDAAKLLADDPDQGKIASLKNDIAQLSHQIQARRLDQQERLSRIFTPEQRRLLRERRGLSQERRALRQERRQLMRERRRLMQQQRRLGQRMRRELRMRPFRNPVFP